MRKPTNPFLVKGYISEEYFCNRKQELDMLVKNIENGIDTTLISPRRYGKTGLLLRLDDYLKEMKCKVDYIYTDIYASRSLDDFTKLLAEAILKKFPEKSSFGTKFFNFLKGFKPLISYDTISGDPQISISYQTVQEKEYTIKGLLTFLDSFNKTIVIAIDEFQQISEYPEKNMEALLRSHIQHLKNLRFIFSGSRKSMLLDIFSNAKRPFFGSTHYLTLGKIDYSDYHAFILENFQQYNRSIDEDAVDFILDWTQRHTFYTQSLANVVFSLASKNTNIQDVKNSCFRILKQNETVYLQYRQLLTQAQWNFLIAIAKEGTVQHITSQEFISKYKIGTPSNARRISQALLEKELLLERQENGLTVIQVYDLFFAKWLEMTY